MSSEIIYHQTCMRIPAEYAGATEDLFVHAVQAGSSNCYEIGARGGCGRRSRRWQAIGFGTATDVLTWGIRTAGDTEGGMLKMGNASSWSTPEAYIRKVRSLLAAAATTDIRLGHSYKGKRVSVRIEWREIVEPNAGKKVTDYAMSQSDSVKAFWSRYIAEEGAKRSAWNFFEVSGPELR